jgi:hypothetical protein
LKKYSEKTAMKLLSKVFSLLSVFKFGNRQMEVVTCEQMQTVIKTCFRWYEQTLNREGLPASSYSIILGRLAGPSARTAAHWLETLALAYPLWQHFDFRPFPYESDVQRLVDWLVSIQRKDGTWPVGSSDYNNRPPSIFQSGIILSALCSYEATFGKNAAIRQAIHRIIQWLMRMQHEDGSWNEYVFEKHLLNTITAAAFIRAGIHLNDPLLIEQGKKAIDHYLSFQIANGFFYYRPSDKKEYFASDYLFFLKGLAQASVCLNLPVIAEKTYHGLLAVLAAGKGSGLVPGIINHQFNAPVNYYSVFGSMLALDVLLTLQPFIKTEEVIMNIQKLIARLISCQMKSDNPLIDGSFPVSLPASGGYKPYEISASAMALCIQAMMKTIMFLTQSTDPRLGTGNKLFSLNNPVIFFV